jgi:superoxide reductase
MCKDQKFFVCKHCGNIIGLIKDAGVPMLCCGEKMGELEANTSDGAVEKHLPVVNATANKVEVSIGSVPHPMVTEHFIDWVYLKTNKGGQRKCLDVGSDPKVSFALTEDEEAVAVFAYCNLHGLWKTDI